MGLGRTVAGEIARRVAPVPAPLRRGAAALVATSGVLSLAGVAATAPAQVAPVRLDAGVVAAAVVLPVPDPPTSTSTAEPDTSEAASPSALVPVGTEAGEVTEKIDTAALVKAVQLAEKTLTRDGKRPAPAQDAGDAGDAGDDAASRSAIPGSPAPSSSSTPTSSPAPDSSAPGGSDPAVAVPADGGPGPGAAGENPADDPTAAPGTTAAPTTTPAPGTTPAPADPPKPTADPEPAAEPGAGSGCDLNTSQLGAVKPHVRAAARFLGCSFGEPTILGVAGRGGSSDHPSGKALDFMVDRATGNALATCALNDMNALGVSYVIWRQRINFGSGWKPMEDRGGPTANHMDHVHVSFRSGAGGRPGSC